MNTAELQVTSNTAEAVLKAGIKTVPGVGVTLRWRDCREAGLRAILHCSVSTLKLTTPSSEDPCISCRPTHNATHRHGHVEEDFDTILSVLPSSGTIPRENGVYTVAVLTYPYIYTIPKTVTLQA